MSKTFTYFRKTGEFSRPVDYGYGIEYEWDGDDGYNFEYTPDDEKLESALIDIVADYFGKDIVSEADWHEFKARIEQLLDDNDLWDDMADSFESELKEAFKKEALESVE